MLECDAFYCVLLSTTTKLGLEAAETLEKMFLFSFTVHGEDKPCLEFSFLLFVIIKKS